MQCLGSITKAMQDFSEVYRNLLRKNKDDLPKWREKLYMWIKGLDIIQLNSPHIDPAFTFAGFVKLIFKHEGRGWQEPKRDKMFWNNHERGTLAPPGVTL